MSDALCGPSNALQNFQKHASVDRTLQQDRLLSRQSPSQGFRSENVSEGALDPEFAAFEASVPGQPLPDIHHAGPFVAPTPHQPMASHMETPNWAADFDRLNISGQSHPIHRQPSPSVAPALAGPQSSGWQNEFMAQQQQPHQPQQTPMQQHRQPYGYGFQPSFAPSYPLNSGPMNAFQAQGQGVAETQQQPPVEAFDESAFAAAFDQAREDMELESATVAQEHGQDINETAQADSAAEQPVAHEEIRIGSDMIPQSEEQKETQQGPNDADELARTAGHLLNSVSHETNQKFQQSNFLALMRRIRDREVHIEGDEFRESAQSLHPGGKYYPQANRQQQMSRPVSHDSNMRIAPDDHSLKSHEYPHGGDPQSTVSAEGSGRKEDLNAGLPGGLGDDNSLYESWNFGDRWA